METIIKIIIIEIHSCVTSSDVLKGRENSPLSHSERGRGGYGGYNKSHMLFVFIYFLEVIKRFSIYNALFQGRSRGGWPHELYLKVCHGI